MADLRRLAPTDTERRGQILLVTGFALAVVFVGLALVFNSVIYTENLATRSESTTTSDPVIHKQSLEAGTERIIEYVNEYNATNASGYDPVAKNVTWAFENMTAVMIDQQLEDGQVVDDSIRDFENGTLVQQTNASRNFTSATNATNWTPINGSANGVRGMEFNVTEIHSGTAFNVTAEDGDGDEWEMKVRSGDAIQVETPSGTTTECGPPSGATPFRINVSAGTVADGSGGTESCSELSFEGLGTVEAVEFNHSDNANGSYSFIVNKTRSNVDTSGVDYGPNSRFPRIDPAIWGVTVEVDYESDVLEYVTDFRVVPGEADA
jgi:hypothetical protein